MVATLELVPCQTIATFEGGELLLCRTGLSIARSLSNHLQILGDTIYCYSDSYTVVGLKLPTWKDVRDRILLETLS